jgi:hypothetical protein
MTIVTSSAMTRPLMPVREVSLPANAFGRTGTGSGAGATIGNRPGFRAAAASTAASLICTLVATCTRVDAALTTVSTFLSPGASVTGP